MEASLLRFNSLPNHRSFLSASPSLYLYPPRRSSATPTARWSASGGCRSRHTAAGGRGGRAKRSEISDCYREMLGSSPNCSLLLRNYAKYLHEVERDVDGAAEYYARAILASPGDGEVLSLYGSLIWEAERDEERAGLYFDQAVNASPDDCMVLGSYAHFLWEAAEEDEEAV